MALGLKKGDVVWTSSISFVASANCALYCDANINFVDINMNTFNIDNEDLEEKINSCQKIKKTSKNSNTCAYGWTAMRYGKIFKLGKMQYGFKIIIEDASHALEHRIKVKKLVTASIAI